DEVMRKVPLQLVTHRRVVADEIASLDEQVEEIEAAAARLQFLVSGERRLKRLLQKRSKICIALAQKSVEVGFHSASECQHLVARHTFESDSFSSLPVPTVTGDLAEGSLETIVVSAAYSLETRIFINEPLNLTKVSGQIIV